MVLQDLIRAGSSYWHLEAPLAEQAHIDVVLYVAESICGEPGPFSLTVLVKEGEPDRRIFSNFVPLIRLLRAEIKGRSGRISKDQTRSDVFWALVSVSGNGAGACAWWVISAIARSQSGVSVKVRSVVEGCEVDPIEIQTEDLLRILNGTSETDHDENRIPGLVHRPLVIPELVVVAPDDRTSVLSMCPNFTSTQNFLPVAISLKRRSGYAIEWTNLPLVSSLVGVRWISSNFSGLNMVMT